MTLIMLRIVERLYQKFSSHRNVARRFQNHNGAIYVNDWYGGDCSEFSSEGIGLSGDDISMFVRVACKIASTIISF